MFHRPEQIGWYGTMLFLVFGFGFYNAAFATDASFTLWLIAIRILVLVYWTFWVQYIPRVTQARAMALALTSITLFLLAGIMTADWPLLIFAFIFAVGHSAVSWQNAGGATQA